MQKMNLIIDIDKIESKEQFLTFIDVILAHDFVIEYNDCGIIDKWEIEKEIIKNENNRFI